MTSNRKILQNKIREFVKKYYLNKLYLGIIIFFMIILVTFIVYSLFEYFSYSNTVVRTILFYSFFALFITTLAVYVVIPLCKLCGLGKQLSNKQIAVIIGRHFRKIDDKLLNLFELEQQMNSGNYKSYDLLSAAIDNKISSFKPYSFVKAVSSKKTKKFARWILIPVSIFVLLFCINSKLFTEPTRRIAHYSQYYEKPAPYKFEIQNKKLTAFQHDDFTVRIAIVGNVVPDELYIAFDNRSFRCHKDGVSSFSYTFSNMQKTTTFTCYTEELTSAVYTITVLPKPITLGFVMELHFPEYIHRPDDILENSGSATVPEGTVIKWNFYTRNSDSLLFIVNNKKHIMFSENDNFIITIPARHNFTYSILNKNKYYTSRDSLTAEIDVIKDSYPEIFVQSRQDSLLADRIYFKGNIRDDYGFSSLYFVYNRYDEHEELIQSNKRIAIPIRNSVTVQDFYYYFDDITFGLKPGDKLEYYFEVSDNDAVNGSKTTKSNFFSYRVRTLEEINQNIDEGNRQTESDFNNLLNESSKLLNEIDKLQLQMIQKKDLSWQDKKNLEQLMNQYQQLKTQLEDFKQQQQNRQFLENRYKNIDPEIIEKQQELQSRMNQILSDEMKETMQKLHDLLKDMDKNLIRDQMNRMKLNTKDIKDALDQQLQLYKQLEIEKRVNETVRGLHELSRQQQENAARTKDKNVRGESLQNSQKAIRQQFNQLKEDINEINRLNRELEEPNKFRSTKNLEQSVDQQIQQSLQNIEKGNRAKSSDNQNNASEDMERIANQLEEDFNESQLENVSEDIEVLRQILDNLVKISFDQEDVLNHSSKINPRSAVVTDLMKQQHQVQDNMKLIEDSLNALARRQSSIRPFIQSEVSKIQNYVENARVNLQNRRTKKAAQDQQFILTSMNNLALMLNESLREMQQEKSNCNSKCKKCGNGSCNKPGGRGKSKKTSARELQQQLNRQLEALRRSMQQSSQERQSPGGQQQQQYSEQFAKMAAEQEAIRKMIEDYEAQLKSQNGIGDQKLRQLINEMKKTENELIHRQLNQQTLQRQQQITTRLLESERADLEREKERERKSTEATEVQRINPPSDWKFDGQETRQNEMLRTVPADLNHYYKEKANLYFYHIE